MAQHLARPAGRVAVVKRRERGMVTAEMMVVAPLAVAFAMLLVWIVSLAMTQVRLADASREAARLVARGESVAQARDIARSYAPDGAIVQVRQRGGVVEVTVRVRAAMPVPFFSGIGAHAMKSVSVAVEESP